MSTSWFIYDVFFYRNLRKCHHSVRSTMKWLGMMRRKMSVMLAVFMDWNEVIIEVYVACSSLSPYLGWPTRAHEIKAWFRKLSEEFARIVCLSVVR